MKDAVQRPARPSVWRRALETVARQIVVVAGLVLLVVGGAYLSNNGLASSPQGAAPVQNVEVIVDVLDPQVHTVLKEIVAVEVTRQLSTQPAQVDYQPGINAVAGRVSTLETGQQQLTSRVGAAEAAIKSLQELGEQLSSWKQSTEERFSAFGGQVQGLVSQVAALATKAALQVQAGQIAALEGRVNELRTQFDALPPAASPPETEIEVETEPAPPAGEAITEECEMKKLLGAALAACLIAANGVASANADLGDDPFVMEGVSYSNCMAAQPYMYDGNGNVQPEYTQHCADFDTAVQAMAQIPTASDLFKPAAESNTDDSIVVAGNSGTADINAVRKFLKSYTGPHWVPTAEEDGSIEQVFMDKPPPADAVPCKPPGYDHMVMCHDK